MKKGALLFWIATLIVVVAGLYLAFSGSSKPSQLDSFAQCLKDRGAVFYGAFWCPHCQRTKQMFGSSAHLLPYVECSTSDGQGQTQICKEKGITGYPTWIFADGSKLEGETTLDQLSQASGCPLPGASSATTTAQ